MSKLAKKPCLASPRAKIYEEKKQENLVGMISFVAIGYVARSNLTVDSLFSDLISFADLDY